MLSHDYEVEHLFYGSRKLVDNKIFKLIKIHSHEKEILSFNILLPSPNPFLF